MTALELFSWVLGETQKRIWADSVPDKKEYAISPEFFNVLRDLSLNHAYADVMPNSVVILEHGGSPNTLEALETPVADGFWVYTFSCSADIHEFRWFEDKADAVNYYNSLELTGFLSQKCIVHTVKDLVLMSDSTNV